MAKNYKNFLEKYVEMQIQGTKYLNDGEILKYFKIRTKMYFYPLIYWISLKSNKV